MNTNLKPNTYNQIFYDTICLINTTSNEKVIEKDDEVMDLGNEALCKGAINGNNCVQCVFASTNACLHCIILLLSSFH